MGHSENYRVPNMAKSKHSPNMTKSPNTAKSKHSPRTKSMWNVKKHSKLIFSTILIIITSFIVNFYLTKDQISETTAEIVVKYIEDIDESWIQELHRYIADRVDKPHNRWDNNSFTPKIGHCKATCEDSEDKSGIFYDSGCQTQPVLIYDNEVTDSLLSKMTQAEATTPCFCKLAQSKIPNANRGIIATKKIPKGLVFGPYTGTIRGAYGSDGQRASSAGYAWRIRSNPLENFWFDMFEYPFINRFNEENADFFIDAIDENNSNWLRYVNTARYREEQNVFALIFNETVYYLTIKDIEPDTELLVWYGYQYAKWLGIYVIDGSTHDWGTDYAPPVNETFCPNCPRTEGKRRREKDDVIHEPVAVENEHDAGVAVKFVETVHKDWCREMQEYIANYIDKPYRRWDRKTFTEQIGLCRATCDDTGTQDGIFYDSECKTHPVYISDREVTQSLLSTMKYAEATMPCFLKVAQSKIPNAGRGAFTTQHRIPKGFIFGPYTGNIRSAFGPDGKLASDAGYSWRIHMENNADFYIDAADENVANWLRFVNTARYREEQNLFSVFLNHTVYYVAAVDIEPDTELLVWYGYQYAKWLNIFVIPSSKHDWDTDYAPPVNETFCPTCPTTKGKKRKESDDTAGEVEDLFHQPLEVDNEEVAAVSMKYVESVEKSWIKELHDYLTDFVDKPYCRFDNKTFTPEIGHCRVTCNDSNSSDGIFFDKGCRTYPLFIYDKQVSMMSTETMAEQTIPCFCKLAQSKIPNANRGIFSTTKIPKGLVLGPYTGIFRSAYGDEGQLARDGGYAWRVNRWDEENTDFYIDAVDENYSNWLRYINTARYREEQNIFPLLFNDTAYYLTIQDIEPDTELLVWYGYKYAKWLDIFVIKNSDHDWGTDYAPPVNETICPSCPRTSGERRREHDDEEEEVGYQENEHEAGIVVKFVHDVEESWIKELHGYVAEHIDKPHNRWDNSTFTNQIGHCRATCNDSVNNYGIFYDKECRTHPVYIYDREVDDSLLATMTYAEATMPCFCKLAESKIPNANRGIFSTRKIPKGFIFGPYVGVNRSAYGDEGQMARDGGYAWRINRWNEENADFYIDGVEANSSNWMRWVNTARYREEQNVFSLLFNDTVYYITIKDIEPDTELLVWYGYKYAKYLQIYVITNSDHDWDTDYAPPVNETICPSCPITEGEKRREYDDDDDDDDGAEGDNESVEGSQEKNKEGEDEEEDEEEEEEEEEQPSCRNNSDDDEELNGDIIIEDPDFELDVRTLADVDQVQSSSPES